MCELRPAAVDDDLWMPYISSRAWLDEFVLASTVARAGATSRFYRAFRSGEFVRLAEGVFLPTSTWRALDPDEQYLVRVQAVARASRPGVVFSHLSAAALWELPSIAPWPTKPEVVVGVRAVGASRHAFTARHYDVPAERELIDGLEVTPLARTLIDVGRTRPLSQAVAMMDRALATKPRGTGGVAGATVTSVELAEEHAAMSGTRGRMRCALALSLADGRSGSPGESLSRVGIHMLGLSAPVLQQEFRDDRGFVGVVDFWWPQFGVIGEFDGHGKYLRAELLNGRSAADAVLAEKLREDRLRALGPTVVRWGWDVARSPSGLARRLSAAGVR